MSKKPISASQHIHKAHDHFFRMAMMDKRVAREFFEMHLPADLQKAIDINQLELQSGTYIDDLRQESIADVLFKTVINEHEAYLYLIVDHQSQPDELMPFRTLKYACNIINQHLKDTGSKRIPLIFPLVVYHGKKPWIYSTDIKDLVDAPSHLITNHFLQTFTLIDIHRIEDEVLKQRTWAGIMELTLKHIFDKDILPYLIDLTELFNQLDQNDSKNFSEIVLTYILDRANISDKETFINIVKTEFSPEVGEKLMTFREHFEAEGIQKGIQQGIQKGIQEGIQQNKLEIAKHLLEKNIDFSFIKEITGLSLTKIKEIHETEVNLNA